MEIHSKEDFPNLLDGTKAMQGNKHEGFYASDKEDQSQLLEIRDRFINVLSSIIQQTYDLFQDTELVYHVIYQAYPGHHKK